MGVEPFNDLAVKNRILQLKIDRLQIVIDAWDKYHGRVRSAFAEAFKIAMRHATPEERRELERLRGLVL